MKVLEHSSGRLLTVAALLLLFASLSIVSLPHTTASTSTGVIVPLYTYPGPMWQGVIQAKQAHPSVPMIAVINPSNGPGGWQDPNILQGVRSLQSVGITVVGYVYTEYGSVSLSSLEAQIRTYQSLYAVNGIFFDQMSNVHGYEWYYSTLNNYVKSIGMSITVGNPGTSVPSSFIGTMNLIVIYENAGLPSLSTLAARTYGYSKQNFAITPYSVSYLDPSYISSASNYLSYMYITNGNYPDPYTALPSYFSSLVADLAGGSGGFSPGTVPLTVESFSTGGSPINGLWTVIRSTSGYVLADGFTPFTYEATPGISYNVYVSNYGSDVFSHWSNGATSNSITVTPTAATTLTAYYQTTSSSNGATIKVESIGSNGAQFSGMWTVIKSSSGQTLATGFTTLGFSATPGATYIVTVGDYESNVFSHWSNWSTSRSITVTASGLTTLVAYYT